MEKSAGLEKIADKLLENICLHSFMSSKVYYMARHNAVLHLNKDGELHFDNYEFPGEAIEFEFKEYGRLLYNLTSNCKYENLTREKIMSKIFLPV